MTSSTPEISFSDFCHTGGECYGTADPVEQGGDPITYPNNSTSFSPFIGDLPSPSERSVTPGDQEVNTYGRAAPFHLSPDQEPTSYEIITAEVAAESSTSSSITKIITPDPHTSPYSWGMKTYLLNGVHDGIGSPISGYPLQLQPVPRAQTTSLDYTSSDAIGYNHPPHGSPPAYRNQAKGKPQSPEATEEPTNLVYLLGSQESPVFDGHHAVTGESRMFFGGNAQKAVVAVGDTDSPSGCAVSLIPGFLNGLGGEGAVRQPAESLPLTTDNVGSRNPKKRERVNTQDDPHGVKRPRYRGPRQLDPPRGQIQVVPPFLLRRPGLRLIPQVPYQSENPQKDWVRLPDIAFNVKGLEGIKLTDALDIYFDGPDLRDDPMFANGDVGNSVSCRIILQGYETYGKARQISTKNHKKERDRITRKKLAQDAAKRIEAHLQDLDDAGASFPVDFKDMFLTKLVHVARASWQPEIWYQASPSTNP